MSDLRDRLTAVLQKNAIHAGIALPIRRAQSMADAVIDELEEIPDRRHVDDQGRTWEWCGGQPGTWAWRITANGPTADTGLLAPATTATSQNGRKVEREHRYRSGIRFHIGVDFGLPSSTVLAKIAP